MSLNLGLEILIFPDANKERIGTGCLFFFD